MSADLRLTWKIVWVWAEMAAERPDENGMHQNRVALQNYG